MSSHTSPLHLLVTSGTETAVVPETVTAVLGTGTPSGPQAKAATSTQARSITGCTWRPRARPSVSALS